MFACVTVEVRSICLYIWWRQVETGGNRWGQMGTGEDRWGPVCDTYDREVILDLIAL